MNVRVEGGKRGGGGERREERRKEREKEREERKRGKRRGRGGKEGEGKKERKKRRKEKEEGKEKGRVCLVWSDLARLYQGPLCASINRKESKRRGRIPLVLRVPQCLSHMYYYLSFFL